MDSDCYGDHHTEGVIRPGKIPESMDMAEQLKPIRGIHDQSNL